MCHGRSELLIVLTYAEDAKIYFNSRMYDLDDDYTSEELRIIWQSVMIVTLHSSGHK